MDQLLQEPRCSLSRLLNAPIKWHKWVSEEREILSWSQNVSFYTDCELAALIQLLVYDDLNL